MLLWMVVAVYRGVCTVQCAQGFVNFTAAMAHEAH